MPNRRAFMKYLAAAGGLGLAPTVRAAELRKQSTPGFFGVHPFVESHPEAVFVLRTSVADKTDSEGKKQIGMGFAREILLPYTGPGVPLTWKIPVKPNLTDSLVNDKNFTLEYGMGIVTDPFFVEGVIEGMKELGLSGKQFYIREVNAPECFAPRGYTTMAERTGADIRPLDTDVREMGKEFVQWKDIPGGVVHRRLPYLWPVNAPETFYLNISKFKTHGTGLTLCCKNNQGTVAAKYQRFCHGKDALTNYHYDHLAPDAVKNCRALHDRHVAEKLPYWDKLVEPGKENGLNSEMWCQRTLDNISATPMGLCVVEGIYGREGCFLQGPNPPLNNSKGIKEARDYMTNILIFGKDPILVDIVGHWLGGHEPGWFGFFHIALERGMSTVLDPRKIPVYRWENGAATLTPLEQFPRTPMLADYIPKDHYFGTPGETFYMYDEPFDYSKTAERVETASFTPGARLLDRCLPNPSSPFLPIEYTLDRNDYARLDILDAQGKCIATPVNGYRLKGSHCAAWDIRGKSKGTYQYRFQYRDFSVTKGFEVRGV